MKTKITVFSNEDDWMQIYVDYRLIYNDHISRFDVDSMSHILGEMGIAHDYRYVQDDEIDSGENRSHEIDDFHA